MKMIKQGKKILYQKKYIILINGLLWFRSSFKQLGEETEDEVDDTDENDKIVRNMLRSSTVSPSYVTLRRTKPISATEAIEETSEE